ncbi:hypothetical protein BaRGS_00035530 [Batillaria attramentaria]|uniref:Uncharacterized protein n=1 Tax=Batillaria attramentaria TaxID=370345 RepID=A0ABD0JEE6_9CAEN
MSRTCVRSGYKLQPLSDSRRHKLCTYNQQTKRFSAVLHCSRLERTLHWGLISTKDRGHAVYMPAICHSQCGSLSTDIPSQVCSGKPRRLCTRHKSGSFVTDAMLALPVAACGDG